MGPGTYKEQRTRRAERRGRIQQQITARASVANQQTDARHHHGFPPFLLSHPRQSKTNARKFAKKLTNISRPATTRTRESGNLLLLRSRCCWPIARNRSSSTPEVFRLATSREDSDHLSPCVISPYLTLLVYPPLTSVNLVPNRPRVPIQGYEDEQ